MPSAWEYGTNSIREDSPPATVDLPAGGAAPASSADIDLTSNVNVVRVDIIITSGAYISWAATAATALSQLGSDATRGKLAGPGAYSIDTRTFAGVISLTDSAGGAVTDGLSYHLVKG